MATARPTRLIRSYELHARIPYTRQHIDRLEKDGKFPKRIKLGPARVVWDEAEVDAWFEAKRLGVEWKPSTGSFVRGAR